ncbi:TonB-dependent receptor [Sphingomonas xanthus]|uniref:TonB-dependent receptor n=1 Tax=Sphingomonas xanthus TaxID=2594473 RepID=A0A516IP87_9SPHN|nr:TonB-dependent receptor [Sphingomonas xanthus]QDP18666.1 TonB-dependent receptor [Sphingomonas xanthus]
MGRFHRTLRDGAAILALVTGSAAAAQSTLPPPDASETPSSTATEPTVAGEIVVTGSRIRRDPLSQEQPIIFVDQEDMAKTGLNSVNDVLQRLPSSGGGLNSKINNSGNLGNPPDGGGVGAGAAEIDLRYLGSRRVLVLVDGIRYVNGASASGVPGSTDLNSIPESAIERIEVLQDGASAIYGSDAIAGVVNIITKKRQAGFAGSAQWGGYDVGDGFTQNYQLSWGNGSNGPLDLVVGGNFVKQGAVSTANRAISRFPNPYSESCADGGCSGFLPNGRYAVLGQDLTLIAPVPPGTTPTLADFRPFADPADRFNFGPFNLLQVPLERYGAFANLKYELAERINFSAKALWNRRKSKNQAAPLPFGVGVASGLTPVLSSIVIDDTNPYNPFGVDLDSSNTRFILRRFVEGGPRRFNQTVDTRYGTATLDGSFDLGGRSWFWDVNAAYGRNKAKQRMLGNIHSGRLRTALGPLATCQATTGCVPFNLFGGAGSITQDMLDYVTFIQNDSSEQKVFDATGNLSGSLFDLPGGPLGVAVGVEYRKLKGRFDPDPVVAAGFSSDIPALPTRGSYSVREAYAEVSAPLLADMPFVDALELTGAVRFSDYSRGLGSPTTFKAGLNWKPVPDLRLRASWAQGFRAPQIGELFGSQSRFDQTLNDPCSSHATNNQPQRFSNNPQVRANCIALGVPADGSYSQANPQISVVVGGNEDLQPETSKSWVVGGVFSPRFLPGFSVEANWYQIRLKDAIQTINANVTLVNCVVNNDPSSCALTTRVNGELTEISGLLQNIAAIRTHGWDVNLAYRNIRTGAGKFNLTWNNTFLRNFDVFVPTTTGLQKLSREGTEVGAPSQAYPKWKSVGTIDWDLTNFGASVTGRYVSKLDDGTTGNKLDSVFYTDVQLRWFAPSFADNFGFALGVNNLFDVKTPGCISCETNNFAVSAHDVPGRYLYARATVKM